jgi:uncharacterized membrane protein YdbT with pleckstrin-like domain
MAYPEDTLAPDEQVLLHTHPHWKLLFWPAVWFVIGTAASGFGAGAATRYLPGEGTPISARQAALWAIAAAWLFFVLLRSSAALLRWQSTHFVITDRRVVVREGVLTHSGIDIPLSRISSVQFRNTLFDRMLGTGTLIIDSASHDPLEYEDIPNVEYVHSLLYDEVFGADG